LWLANDGYYGAVGGFAGVNVEEAYAVNFFYFVGYLFDDVEVVAFGEVWDALDELHTN